MTTLNRMYAAIASTPTATTLPPTPASAPPPSLFSMFSLMCPLEQVRGSGGHVSIEPRERHAAQHPARPVDGEAECPQPPQEPPRQSARVDAQVARLLRNRHAVESCQHPRHELPGRARHRRPDVAVGADPTQGRRLAGGGIDRR